MSTIRILLKVEGSVYVELNEERYRRAASEHAGDGGSARLDKMLDAALSGMDTEVTVIEPDGSEYQL